LGVLGGLEHRNPPLHRDREDCHADLGYEVALFVRVDSGEGLLECDRSGAVAQPLGE
jgi:hypothetical protein